MSSNRPFGSANRPAGGVDQSVLHENRKLVQLVERRGFLRGGLSLGALTMLTGCDVTNDRSVQTALRRISDFNTSVQEWLFDPNKLAPTYADADVMNPPRFNAFYPKENVKPVNGETWRLELYGLIENKKPWTVQEIGALPEVTQITRHVCVEGWDYIGKWSGVNFKTFLERIGADLTAKYVFFRCADGYTSSIDMASALHPQTQLTTKYADQTVPDLYGFPIRLRAPTKLGFKLPKWIMGIEVTNQYLGGYWEDRGYNWFSGV